MSERDVTVIGLGPMGQAIAGALLDSGHRVTVWNRTASRADELVARGAGRAGSVREALAASELVILSLTDHDAMYAVLDPAADALSGRVLVNLGSDTPEKSRAAARWAAGHGAQYLTGGVQASPRDIGQPGSFTFYSGPRAVFDAHQDTLRVLTGTDYRGEDPALAALYYQLTMDMFWTAVLGWLHAVAVAGAHGVSARELLPYASPLLSGLPDFLAFCTPRIDAGEHPGDADRLAMGAASVDHVVHTARDAGVDTALPEAVLAVFRRGMAAGHADDSVTSLVEVLKRAVA
ncbi:NAD(P)-dependent oxidoreductase [Streptomyces litchfieldiae]|uniref:NAD(P)-binding domain-containing protein n=1 Tax=Streptomyces litchfieldiae TaxID=3075543 RepID=A0ABU2MKZ9_9ACTN|nr:NAD(P)-binding domain-containing protein [Streptomyces sp. DSM 44938]MDT0342291.1 NAD(P)-binding domain-containing protein [Streptomyces sp. DSM 44938]